MAFDPDAFLAQHGAPAPAMPSGFNPDAFLQASLPDFLKQRGKLESDGNYSVETPNGPFRFTPKGEAIQADAEKAGLESVGEPSTKVKVLNRVETALGGAGMGLSPTLAGINAVKQNVFGRTVGALVGAQGEAPSMVDAYRHGRDEAAKTLGQASDEAGVGYQIAGAVAGAGPFAPATAGARLALMGGIGGLNAATASRADATRLGEGNNAALLAGDVAKGVGIGVAGGALGEGLGAASRALGRYASTAAADQATKVATAAEKALASKTGELGNAGLAMQNAIDRGQHVVDNPTLAGHTPDLVQKAAEFLASPGAAEARTRAAENAMARVPSIVNKFDRLAAERTGLQALAQPAAVQQVADQLLSKPWVPLAQRAETILKTHVPFEVGKRVGAELGTAAGQMSETVAGSLLGTRLTALANAMKDPRTRYLIGKAGAAIFGLPAGVIQGAVGPTARGLTEANLGSADLAAEKLVISGGLGRTLGAGPPEAATEPPINTPAGMALKRDFGITAAGHAIQNHDSDVDSAVQRVLSGTAEPRASADVLNTQDFGAKRMRRDAADSHQQRIDEIRQLAASPEQLVDRLANNTGALAGYAPGVAGAVARTAQTAVAYLAQAAQEPPKAGPLAPDWTHTESERFEFGHILDVVQDPMRSLHAAASRTLTDSQVDAVKAVYPLWHRATAEKMLLAAMGAKSLPYATKLAISVFTGQDLDGSLSQEAIAANQSAISSAAAKEPGDMGGKGGKSGGKMKLSLGSRMALPGQRKELQDEA